MLQAWIIVSCVISGLALVGMALNFMETRSHFRSDTLAEKVEDQFYYRVFSAGVFLSPLWPLALCIGGGYGIVRFVAYLFRDLEAAEKAA